VAASTTTVSETVKVTDATAPVPTVTLTASNVPSGGLFVLGATTQSGIATLSPGLFGATTAQIQIFFKAPYTLRPSTYDDSVTLEVCTDRNCTNQIAGSPIQVAVQYTVSPVTGSSAPTVVVSNNSFSVQALPTDNFPPTQAQDGISVHNAPSFPLTVNVTSTSNGLASVVPTLPLWVLVPPTNLGGPMMINYKNPSQLAPGLYQDTIKVTACLDSACVNPLAGSPQIITVSYLVGNSIPGNAGDTVTQLPLHAHDLVWDSVHAVIYASVAADSVTDPNTIAVINPVSGAVTSSVSLGYEPQRIAVSGDGAYLYVGQHGTSKIVRYALPAFTVDATLDVGSSYYPWDIEVAPGAPKTFAVSRSGGPASISAEGVMIFDDTTARPTIAGFNGTGPTAELDYLAWGADATTLYGDDSYTSGQTLSTMNVTASGAQVTSGVPGITAGKILYVDGRIYSDNGNVFDPATGKTIASLATPAYDRAYAIAVDSTVSRVYLLAGNGSRSNDLFIYDRSTLSLLRSQTILGPQLSPYTATPDAFIRWGTNGLAWASADGQVVIIAGVYLTS
jgi:hypothetical protein